MRGEEIDNDPLLINRKCQQTDHAGFPHFIATALLNQYAESRGISRSNNRIDNSLCKAFVHDHQGIISDFFFSPPVMIDIDIDHRGM